jgi:hypothetical protein
MPIGVFTQALISMDIMPIIAITTINPITITIIRMDIMRNINISPEKNSIPG